MYVCLFMFLGIHEIHIMIRGAGTNVHGGMYIYVCLFPRRINFCHECYFLFMCHTKKALWHYMYKRTLYDAYVDAHTFVGA